MLQFLLNDYLFSIDPRVSFERRLVEQFSHPEVSVQHGGVPLPPA